MSPSAKRNFIFFLASRIFTLLALQIVSVAVAWQVYAMTKSALHLGYVGLAIFVPTLLMALPGGRLADYWPRRRIMILSSAISILCTLALIAISLGEYRPTLIFTVLVFYGMARSLGNPATSAYLPQLIGDKNLPRAIAINSTMFQFCTVVGPSSAGLLYAAARDFSIIYCISLGLMLIGLFCLSRLPRLPAPDSDSRRNLDLLGGLKFVFRKKLILGAISLDLFAVLLGGATALLPIYASDILDVGAAGLGFMRSAPALGASMIAIYIGFRPLRNHVGQTMLIAVGIFGVATVVFGYSQSFVLSIICLITLGAADMISVVIRQTLIQLHTPNAMRGRVSAVSMVFIGASNELGDFESGLTASWWGPVTAVAVGGIGTCIIVLTWAWLFPQLRRVDRFLDSQDVDETIFPNEAKISVISPIPKQS